MDHSTFRVVDPRLAAGRGEEFSAGKKREATEAQLPDESFSLPIDQRVEDSLDTDGLQMASVHEAIPQSNRGFQMLQSMGWKGQGLGLKEDGIQEPVGGGSEAGVRLGLGKHEEDEFYTASDNIQRKRLEVEIQADEDEDRAAKREFDAERQSRIKQEVSDIKRTFYCEVCHKQYSSAAEMDVHLSSYDHHHKKRLVEMRSAEYERTRKGRDKREKRRQEKEMARLNEQIQKAHGVPFSAALPGDSAQPPISHPAAPSNADIEPPPPPPENAAPPSPPQFESQPPLPSAEPPRVSSGHGQMPGEYGAQRSAVQFNMGAAALPKVTSSARSSVAPLGVLKGGIQKKPQRLKASVAAFAQDSDDDS